VADVGDNNERRKSVTIYLVEIPSEWQSSLAASQQLTLPTVATFQVSYPSGPVNCEALAYDPLNREFILATKELLQCRLFGVDASQLTGTQSIIAQGRGVLTLPLVTAADISTDGRRMVLTTYGPGCLLTRPDGAEPHMHWTADPVLKTLQMFELPTRKQGESIAFDRDANHLWLTSEFSPTPLWHIPRP
jgi:hypothetical protein